MRRRAGPSCTLMNQALPMICPAPMAMPQKGKDVMEQKTGMPEAEPMSWAHCWGETCLRCVCAIATSTQISSMHGPHRTSSQNCPQDLSSSWTMPLSTNDQTQNRLSHMRDTHWNIANQVYFDHGNWLYFLYFALIPGVKI